MNNYCVDLNLELPIFNSELSPVDFLKKNYKLTNHFQVNIEDLHSDLLLFFNNLQLTIRLVEIFYRPPGGIGIIHSDMNVAGDYAKLNWVYGGDNSVMNWYKINSNYTQPLLNTTNINSYALYYKTDEVDLIHSQTIGLPSLVQVGCPHNVVNGSTERFCISLVFENSISKKRLTFNEAVALFKNYIK